MNGAQAASLFAAFDTRAEGTLDFNQFQRLLRALADERNVRTGARLHSVRPARRTRDLHLALSASAVIRWRARHFV